MFIRWTNIKNVNIVARQHIDTCHRWFNL